MHELNAAFGVLYSGGNALRESFLIDPDGIVGHAAFTDTSVGRAAGELLRLLLAFQTAELCPVDWPARPASWGWRRDSRLDGAAPVR